MFFISLKLRLTLVSPQAKRSDGSFLLLEKDRLFANRFFLCHFFLVFGGFSMRCFVGLLLQIAFVVVDTCCRYHLQASYEAFKSTDRILNLDLLLFLALEKFVLLLSISVTLFCRCHRLEVQ